MKKVNVYGSGCANCTETVNRFIEVAQDMNIKVSVEKTTNLKAIMLAGIMSTPGVAIDGVVKHTGSVPSKEVVVQLLTE